MVAELSGSKQKLNMSYYVARVIYGFVASALADQLKECPVDDAEILSGFLIVLENEYHLSLVNILIFVLGVQNSSIFMSTKCGAKTNLFLLRDHGN